MVERKVLRRITIAVIFTLILYVILVFFGKVNALKESFLSFNPTYLIPVLILVISNYFLRYLRWELFLRSSGINIPFKRSLLIFISGFLGSITPGKIGESLKSLSLKNLYNIPLSKSLPIVFLERFNDLTSSFLLILIGILFFDYGRVFSIIVGSIIFFVLIMLLTKPVQLAIFHFILRFRVFKKSGGVIYSALKSLLTPKITLVSTIYGTIAWALEGIALWVVLLGFGVNNKMIFTIFIYVSASVIGAFSMLPGGVGVTEGGLLGGLLASNIPRATAIASTILIRLLTLWYAVFLGIIANLILLRRGNRLSENERKGSDP